MQELRVATRDLVAPAAVPGYVRLTRRDRTLTDLRAWRLVFLSRSGARLAAAYAGWWLAGKSCIWHLDMRGMLVYLPEFTALLWLLPLAAWLRRRALRRLLGPHWSRL